MNKKQGNNAENKAGRSPAFSRSARALKTVAIGLFAALFWIGVWYLFSRHIGKEIILPSPFSVLNRLAELAVTSEFRVACGMSILRIICGTILGCTAGIILAALMLISKIARVLIYPLLSAIKAAPVASFIIAALFWISRVRVPAFISFLIVLPVVCDSVYTGVKNADMNLLEVAKVYKFPFIKRLFYILIPSAVPYFLSALRTSIGMAWKSGVAAEVLCTPQNSIGKELYLTKVYMETSDMFAWTLTIILLSIIFEKISIWLVSRGLKKYGAEKEDGNAED